MTKTEFERKETDRMSHLDNFIFPKIDSFFYRKQNFFFYLSLFILILFGILLFDLRISEGGDDSAYLLDAKKFIDGISFPSFHGAFYTILLGILMKCIGFHLILFKILSFVFLIGHQIFFYFTFRNRVSPFLLISVLLIISINSSLIYFGSQTYTETFYMFLQSLLFFILIKYFIDLPNNFKHLSSSWILYILLGVVLFMLSTTRNIGLGAVFIVVLFLFLEKKYIPLLITILSYFLFKIPYNLYRKYVWGIIDSDLRGQINIALQKNPYNNTIGNENLSGIVVRFIENSKIYLSNLLIKILNIKDANYIDTNIFLSLIIILILITGFFIAYYSRKKIMQPVFLYLVTSLSITFVSLHQMWSQTRLLIIFVPFLLLSMAWAFSELSKRKVLYFLKIIPVLIFAIIFFREFVDISKKAHIHQKILTKNLGGDKYFGYTPDMVNFLRLSEISSKKVPENIMIGSRKASMSFIYGNGREFYPIYKLPFENVDSVLYSAQNSGKILYFIDEVKFKKNPSISKQLLKKAFFAAIVFENSVYGLYLVPPDQKQVFELALTQAGIQTALSLQDFKVNILQNEKESSALIPDKLLNEYKANKVQYLISAKLRYDANLKNNQTINTVERSMATISIKYPGIFIKVMQVGRNNDEPASLYRIDYNKFNLK